MINLSFEVNYKLDDQKTIKEWLNLIAKEEGNDIEELNFLFVDDQKMLDYNKKYLQHDYYTDIITFNSSRIHIDFHNIIKIFFTHTHK